MNRHQRRAAQAQGRRKLSAANRIRAIFGDMSVENARKAFHQGIIDYHQALALGAMKA